MVKIIAKKIGYKTELETALKGSLPEVTEELANSTVSILQEILESLPAKDRLWYLQGFIRTVYNELSTENTNKKQKGNEYEQ